MFGQVPIPSGRHRVFDLATAATAGRNDPEAWLNGFGATRASEPTTLKLPPRAAP